MTETLGFLDLYLAGILPISEFFEAISSEAAWLEEADEYLVIDIGRVEWVLL